MKISQFNRKDIQNRDPDTTTGVGKFYLSALEYSQVFIRFRGKRLVKVMRKVRQHITHDPCINQRLLSAFPRDAEQHSRPRALNPAPLYSRRVSRPAGCTHSPVTCLSLVSIFSQVRLISVLGSKDWLCSRTIELRLLHEQ